MMKKIMIISSIAIVLAFSIMAVGANDDKEGIREHAKNVIEQTNGKESKVIAKVYSAKKTIELTDTQVKTFCLNSEYITKKPKDEKDALESMINEKVEYLIACEEGYEVSEDAIQKKIQEAKETIKSEPEQKVFLENYIEALGIDEDKYYDMVYDSYKISLTIGNYKNNYVKNELIKIDKKFQDIEFTEQYNNAIEDFMKRSREKYISDNKIKVERY